MENEYVWKIINTYFRDNPQALVTHHIESYNEFFNTGIFKIFREKNPIEISARWDEIIGDYRSKCIMYMGGRDGTRVYFGKPIIYDETRSHYMYPNEARLRNMTYGMTVHYDIEIDFIDILEKGEAPKIIGGGGEEDDGGGEDVGGGEEYHGEVAQDGGGKKEIEENPNKPRAKDRKKTLKKFAPTELATIREATEKSMINENTQRSTHILENIYLGKFPIMVQSNYCILSKLSKELRFSFGECRNDTGGYFIIDGKEKSIIPQEKFADNILYTHKFPPDDKYILSIEIRSVSENVSKPKRTLAVKLVAPSNNLTGHNIVVTIPNVRAPVPIFILFRALGILSDKDIIQTCLLDLDKYESMTELFVPSIYDAGAVMTQRAALKYIGILTKGKTVTYALEILTDYFFPHIGETNFTQKAYYLGYMIFRLLNIHTGVEEEINRDNFKFKRIETTGSLLNDLFQEYYTKQLKEIHLEFEKKLYYNEDIYSNNLYTLITENYKDVFINRVVDAGFKKAFKGNWGAQPHTKRIGVVQDLNRLSFFSAMAQMRKTSMPLDAGLKIVGPRLLHSSQWGFFDPLDTPDGGNIGLIKNLAISAYITNGMPRELIVQWLRRNAILRFLEECQPQELAQMTRVFINGYWCGSLDDPIECVNKFKLFRRNGLLPIQVSISFDIKHNSIFIYTDKGRLTRPLFYKDANPDNFAIETPAIMERINRDEFTWEQLLSGFHSKKVADFNPYHSKVYELTELYEGIRGESNPAKQAKFIEDKAVIDYIDTNESEDLLIALRSEDNTKYHTHLEIHPSFIFGAMSNMINFPENNPATRNAFSSSQSKQAVSLYHTNHQMRMDKSAVVMNTGEIPIVKTRYLEYVTNEENYYGKNVIVAIMVYSGYNMEDSILINEGSLKRGLFRTTYYTTYETHEEKSNSSSSTGGEIAETSKVFGNIENTLGVVGQKPGYDYSKLDDYGLILENTPVNDKTVLIGMTSGGSMTASVEGEYPKRMDDSVFPKKGQLGYVDKSFITEGEEGQRIAKVRIREQRIPSLGDKLASRAGQKGTVGLVMPESDFPFTKDGIRPDLIINPHAIPSRMTIGQLVETLIGKASVMYGSFADASAFQNRGSKVGIYGELLSKIGYHSSGNEILYNGMTGEQVDMEIFMGPTYYMRLKHMVKDKINFRAQGPRTALTRQPVSGRANDGGLRIGEMERDGVISHGAANFLTESMMERGDKYYMAVCNTTGMIAVYNPDKKIFISPMADGPLKFVGVLDKMNVSNITKYGRSFSVVSVPYSFKLLIQELLTIGMELRIITEDNIEQLENMSFSGNVEKLTGRPIEDIIRSTRENIGKISHIQSFPPESPEYAAAAISPQYPYQTTTPPYPPPPYPPPPLDGSPEYAPALSGSPEYAPPLEGSPEYAPAIGTPEYAPPLEGSPEYAPAIGTPEYAPPLEGSPEYLLKGGTHPFVKNQTVFLRNDTKPRLWTIERTGLNFITIRTNDSHGIDNLDNMVRVVKKDEIYEYDPQIATTYMQELHQNEQSQIQQPYKMGQYFSPSQPVPSYPVPSYPVPSPPVPSPPVINVIVGNNNKTTNDLDTESDYNANNSNEEIAREEEKINEKKGGGEQEAPKKNMFEKAIDFTKGLFIKKMP